MPTTIFVHCRDILCFQGFRSPWYKQLLFAFLGICTGGLLFLVAKWSLTVRIVLQLKRCRLKEAQYVRTTVGISCQASVLHSCRADINTPCHQAVVALVAASRARRQQATSNHVAPHAGTASPYLHCSARPTYVQLRDGRVSLNEVVVMQPANTASHPYLSAQHHPELLLEAVSGRVDAQLVQQSICSLVVS
jgi:hypothetical protein